MLCICLSFFFFFQTEIKQSLEKGFSTDSECGLQPGVPELLWTHPQSMQADTVCLQSAGKASRRPCAESTWVINIFPDQDLFCICIISPQDKTHAQNLPHMFCWSLRQILWNSAIVPPCRLLYVFLSVKLPSESQQKKAGGGDQPGRNATERPIQTFRPLLCMICIICIPNAVQLCSTACMALLVRCGYGVTCDP